MKASKLLKCSMGLAATGSILLAGQAKADFSVDSANYGSESSQILSGGSPVTLTLDKFNTALGTLNSVEITLTSYDSVTSFVNNGTASPISYTGVGASMTVTANALAGLSTSATASTTPASGTATTEGINYVATQSIDPLPASETLTSGLAAYEGTSGTTFDVTVPGFAVNVFGSVPPFTATIGGGGYSYGTVEIQYDYTPVAAPEPSALLGGFGILGSLAAMAWRKRKQ